MKTARNTPDGKYEILYLQFKDFDDLPKSLLISRESVAGFDSED